MKILLTTIFNYPHGGGLSTHVKTLKAGLEHYGHKVDVLSFSDIHPMKQNWVRGNSLIRNTIKSGSGFIWSQKKRQHFLQKKLAEYSHKYDVINAQDVMAAQASLIFSIPVILTVHGYMAYEAVSKGSIIKNSDHEKILLDIEKEAYQKVSEIVTVDRRIKDYVKTLSGRDATAIPNFINVEEFKPDKANHLMYRKELAFSPDDFIYFVPRRLTEKNGVIYPILAFDTVLKEVPNAKLVYAGMGEEYDRLKREINERKLNKQVILLGEVSHEQMMNYYAISNVVLIPSIHSQGVEEATSIAALEAMGSESPVIASAVGGLKEIFTHNEDGLLVEEKNIDQLSQAMVTLAKNPQLRERLAKKAREKVELKHSHLSAAKKYEEVYLKALAKN